MSTFTLNDLEARVHERAASPADKSYTRKLLDKGVAHCAKKLGMGHKQTRPEGLFTLEEVECIGACSWAPAAQVNYDFHENLTPEKMDRILDEYTKKVTQ